MTLKYLPAITGVSSPNCGDKIEVQLLFMALGRYYQDNICSKNPVNPTTLNGSPKHDFKTVCPNMTLNYSIIVWAL